MKNRILEFLNNREAILWIKTYNYKEVEKIFLEDIKGLENKRLYVYENGITINKENNSPEVTMNDLFTTLDELYPQGIRKIPVILIIKKSMEEILKKENLEYIKEIAETKRENPKYNFTIVIVNNKRIYSELIPFSKYIKKSDLDNENNIRNYIINLAELEKIKLNQKEVESILTLLKKDIEKISNKQQLDDSYLQVPMYERKNIKIKDMILVKGGKYKPSFLKEEKEIFDIEVCKYQVTQEMWEDIMENNPSIFKNKNNPVNMISWWGALEYCNKLSERYDLVPVYDLSRWTEQVLKIKQLDGKVYDLDEADFKEIEGFRLPTEIEWEWFARGGEVAQREGGFYFKYSGSNSIDEVAWYYKNSGESKKSSKELHEVALKKANQLGIYDCSGNLWEWTFDTEKERNVSKESIKNRITRGGSYYSEAEVCMIDFWDAEDGTQIFDNIGFRVVRTI